MNIPEEHKILLKELGLTEDDFKHFDGEFVNYAYDEKRGVRLYDPLYTTSYNEYIDVDGWSAWSDESDTFMSDMLVGVRERVERVKAKHESAGEDLADSLKARFGKKDDEDG
jgi:hypothetical protein